MIRSILQLTALLCTLLGGVLAEAPANKEIPPPTRAIAYVVPTKGNKARGWVRFKTVKEEVHVTAQIDGLSPGKHGIHIHEFGDCSAPDGSSAGGHFNPTNEKHGGPDDLHRHVGDLGNLVADDNGVGIYDKIDRVISLTGPYSIIGKSIIIHAAPDDYKTQPTGNAGGRLGCGIIEER